MDQTNSSPLSVFPTRRDFSDFGRGESAGWVVEKWVSVKRQQCLDWLGRYSCRHCNIRQGCHMTPSPTVVQPPLWPYPIPTHHLYPTYSPIAWQAGIPVVLSASPTATPNSSKAHSTSRPAQHPSASSRTPSISSPTLSKGLNEQSHADADDGNGDWTRNQNRCFSSTLEGS